MDAGEEWQPGVGYRVLTLRELNRATLARQMLLERLDPPVQEAVSRVAGLQAQVVGPPYTGLWSRLRGFRREDLTGLVEERRVVRATMMRATLHLVTAEDYLVLRPALQPALTRSLRSIAGRRLEGLDLGRVVAAARAHFEETPRTFAELRGLLSEIAPDRDPSALAYLVRTQLPLVQVASGGPWGYPSKPSYALAESWLGCPLSGGVRDLVRRYLGAFGPATVRDIHAWSGMVRLKEPVEELKAELSVYRDEKGNELLDLPDAPLPPPDTPAPVRFVPEYDNLVLSHADRARVISDEHRKKVFLSAARVQATFLLDGFVSGTWKIERGRSTATLQIEPFEPLPSDTRETLAEEGEQLLRFAASGGGETRIRFEQ